METKCTTRSLAEYEVIALRNKVNKMQTQINKLTSENTSLKAKVTTLETLIAHLYAQLNITLPCYSDNDNDNDNEVAFPFTLEQQWLYHDPGAYRSAQVLTHPKPSYGKFHLPESTLVMLVSALAGRENVLAAYKEAVDERYRFFSFGDAMFIE